MKLPVLEWDFNPDDGKKRIEYILLAGRLCVGYQAHHYLHGQMRLWLWAKWQKICLSTLTFPTIWSGTASSQVYSNWKINIESYVVDHMTMALDKRKRKHSAIMLYILPSLHRTFVTWLRISAKRPITSRMYKPILPILRIMSPKTLTTDTIADISFESDRLHHCLNSSIRIL